MANSVQILNKIARDAGMLGLTVNSLTETALVIADGNLDMLVAYEEAQIQAPMGGIDDTTSPFLGANVQNPGMILVSCNAAGNKTIAQTLSLETDLIVLALCCGFANTVLVMDGDEGYGVAAVLATIPGDAVLRGIGQ